ncbi:DNA-directed RNA polymerase subunit delta [Candidatus Mycoplasma haematohominis]|uniref:RNAP delta factor n=1 Tax=Candidatus Mycoplasma haematohominis TaxID=1494318 RepID=A0A478FUN2_9MOLU|nr:DNA-directed RNA polymerase subunit delta [Candidatus Mycoplasma haemohominis]GCE63760.1 DNA-directed RNA polymerase subunit delta [Candidatus Mycoplasma haemohominis]
MSLDNSAEDVKREPVQVLHVTELVDIAYGIAKEQFQNQFFSFSEIWSKVWKSAERFSKEKVEDWIGYFYTELILDPRFTIYGFNNWKLREFVPLNEIKKLEKTIFSDDAVFEEEYEAYITSVKNKNKEVEIIPSDETASFDPEEDSSEEEETSDEEAEDGASNRIEKDELFESEEE